MTPEGDPDNSAAASDSAGGGAAAAAAGDVGVAAVHRRAGTSRAGLDSLFSIRCSGSGAGVYRQSREQLQAWSPLLVYETAWSAYIRQPGAPTSLAATAPGRSAQSLPPPACTSRRCHKSLIPLNTHPAVAPSRCCQPRPLLPALQHTDPALLPTVPPTPDE